MVPKILFGHQQSLTTPVIFNPNHKKLPKLLIIKIIKSTQYKFGVKFKFFRGATWNLLPLKYYLTKKCILLLKESQLRDEIEQIKQRENDEKQKLKIQINNEKKLTEEAVKKLFQIVQEKKPKNGNVKNVSETKRIEKEHKRLQLELSKERENYAQMHKLLNQEIQALKEDLDKREQEVLKYKSLVTNSVGSGLNLVNGIMSNTVMSLTHNLPPSSPLNNSVNMSTYSINSTCVNQFDDTLEYDNQDRLENWLSIPNKRNIKKHGWKKLYVVLRKGKLFFYNSLKDNRESQEPYMTIDLEKVYHVRPVTQTDVVRAGTRDVAKIFQILYDVDAVSGSGSFTYLGATGTEAKRNTSGNSNTSSLYSSGIENSPSMNSTTVSTTTLHNSDNFSDSAVGGSNTIRSINSQDDYQARMSSDAISVGSNDSGDVRLTFVFFVDRPKIKFPVFFFWLFIYYCISMSFYYLKNKLKLKNIYKGKLKKVGLVDRLN